MAFFSSHEIKILKALMTYIDEYKAPQNLNLTATLSQDQKNKLPDPLKTSANITTIEHLIHSNLTAEELKDVLTPEQCLHKRIVDIKKFLAGPTASDAKLKSIRDFFGIRFNRFQQDDYFENFVEDVKALLKSQHEDVVKKFNEQNEETLNSYDVGKLKNFNYSPLMGNDPGLQMWAILRSYQKTDSWMDKFSMPVYFKKILQPHPLRDFIFIVVSLGMLALTIYSGIVWITAISAAGFIAGCIATGKILASVTYLAMTAAFGAIALYFIGAATVNSFIEKSPDEGQARTQDSGQAPISNTGPGYGFTNATSFPSSSNSQHSTTSSLDAPVPPPINPSPGRSPGH